jgi:hypothetical protein
LAAFSLLKVGSESSQQSDFTTKESLNTTWTVESDRAEMVSHCWTETVWWGSIIALNTRAQTANA